MELLQHVRTFIREHDLLPAEGKLVVGISGGPDSLCMLDLLHKLSPELRVTLEVAHLNHGLRAEAEAEAERVRAEAQKRGLAFHTARVDTRAYAQTHGLSIEEAARELRYAFFIQTARSAGASTVAVAHTADDQAETVLMHFLRGTGLAGLRGMQAKSKVQSPKAKGQRPKSRVQSRKSIVHSQQSNVHSPESEVHSLEVDSPPATRASGLGTWDLGLRTWDLGLRTSDLWLIRPLLEVTRAEVEAYCAENHLQPVYDATNQDTTYFRNRLRHVLLPDLEKYNPNFRAGLRRTAEVLAGDYELVRGLVDKLWANGARLEADRVILDKAHWSTLSVPEQRALLREAIARLQGHARDMDFAPIESAVRFSRRAQPGRSCEVLGGLRLYVAASQLTLGAEETAQRPAEDWPRLGEANELAPGWRFEATRLKRGEWSLETIQTSAARWRVYADAARLSGPLSLRPRRPGDSFHPLGLGGHSQKVSDCMVNAKLEAPARNRWPLVICGEAIVWVVGLGLDERFKVTSETEDVVRLEFVREGARGWGLGVGG